MPARRVRILKWQVPMWLVCLGLLALSLGVGGIVQATDPCLFSYCPSGTNNAAVRFAEQADVGYGWTELQEYAPNHVFVALRDVCANSASQPQVVVLNADPRKPTYRWTCPSLDQLGQTVIVIRKGKAENYELTALKSDALNPDGLDLICNFHHDLDLNLYFRPEAVKAYVAEHCRN